MSDVMHLSPSRHSLVRRWSGRRGGIALVQLVAAVLALGCGGATAPRVYQQLTLVGMDGGPLPAVVVRDPTRVIYVVEASITLNDDGTWQSRTALRETVGETTTEREERAAGTYAMSGTSLTLFGPQREILLSGARAASGLEYTLEGEHVYAYAIGSR